MSIIIQVTPPAGDPVVLDPVGVEGAIGSNGWTPVLAIEFDGERAVQKIIDWAGGEDVKPAVGQYVAEDGSLVSDIADGADIRGPQGLQGVQGDPGQILTSGSIFTGDGVPSDSNGVDNDIYIDNLTADLYQKQAGHWVLQTNIKGAKGDKGDTGNAGAAGSAGVNGATILIGTGVPSSGLGANGDIYVESVTFTLYRKSGGVWSVVGVFKGAAGTSVRVAAGVPANNIGADNDSYIDSANGNLYVRSAGTYTLVGNLTGPQGNDGAQGSAGPQGAAGTSTRFGSGAPASGLGNNGDSYIDTTTFNLYTKSAGAWSNVGTLKGADGVGNAIFTGPGVPGTIPPSIAGDIYIDTTNGDVYQKVGVSWGSPIINIRGPQGSAGAAGTPGSAGSNGSNFLSGNGIPASGLGVNGDTYLDKATGNLYGPKSGGAWGSVAGSLKGAAGDQGPAGSAGARGSVWYTGATTPPGAQSGQQAGDYYMVTGTGRVWKLIGSTWTDQAFNISGPQGAAGATGAAGTLWYQGSSFPTIPPAREGDLLFHTVNYNVYQVIGSAWSAIANIKGPQGDAGTAGTNGSNGTDGTNGWSPVFANVTDGARRVLQVVDWIGGTSGKPSTTNQFVGASGFVSTAAAAVDVRGAAGADGATGATGPSNLPGISVSAARTITSADKGQCLVHPSADTSARVWTIDNTSSWAAASGSPAVGGGDTISFMNMNGAGAITIAISGASAVLRQVGTTNTGSRTLAANGYAVAWRLPDNLTWYISGVGLT